MTEKVPSLSPGRGNLQINDYLNLKAKEIEVNFSILLKLSIFNLLRQIVYHNFVYKLLVKVKK